MAKTATAEVTNIEDVKKSSMENFNELLGTGRELHILKGQLLNPVIMSKKEGTGHYMAFRLKTLRNIGDDEYGQRNNMYQIIVSEEKAKQLTSQYFREVKDQEVIVLVDVVNMTKKGQNSSPVYFNNVSYYLIDILKTRDITQKEPAVSAGGFQEI